MHYYDIVKSFVFTEKTNILQSKNMFTFYVDTKTNKKQIASVISKIFDVKVLCVNSMLCKGKNVRFKSVKGQQKTRKKVIVKTDKVINLDKLSK